MLAVVDVTIAVDVDSAGTLIDRRARVNPRIPVVAVVPAGETIGIHVLITAVRAVAILVHLVARDLPRARVNRTVSIVAIRRRRVLHRRVRIAVTIAIAIVETRARLVDPVAR